MSSLKGILLPISDIGLVKSDPTAYRLVHSTVSPKPIPRSSNITTA